MDLGQSEPSFSRFHELPKEIRLVIWEMALPGPRVVYLEQDLLNSHSCNRVWSNKIVDGTDDDEFHAQGYGSNDSETQKRDELGPLSCRAFRSQSPAPPLLFACRESFEVASQFYAKAFGTWDGIPETWFCFERDILVLDWGWEDGMHYDLEDFSDDDLKSVRKLAFFYPNDRYTPSDVMQLEYEEWLAQCLEGFCNLETLYFTTWPDQRRMTDRSNLALLDLRAIAFQKYVFSQEYNPEEEAKFIDDCRALEDMLKVDKERLNHFREEWTTAGSLAWNIPKFKHTLIRTIQTQIEFKMQEAEFNRKKDLYYRKLKLSGSEIR
jgi:hypothetical protein